MRGQWQRTNKKRLVSACLQLDIARIGKDVDFEHQACYLPSLTRGGRHQEVKNRIHLEVIPGEGVILQHTYQNQKVEPYLVPVTSTTPNYGGKRYWFLCPNQTCGRRVRILYGGKQYLCRHCHRLTYQTSQQSSKLTSIDNRLAMLSHKLGARGHLLDELSHKPPRMHIRTYIKLSDEYNALLRRRQQTLSTKVSTEVITIERENVLVPANSDLSATAVEQNIQGRSSTQARRGTVVTPKKGKSVTLGQLSKLAGIPSEFVVEVEREGLIQPDAGRTVSRKRYRPKLKGWLTKLYTLRNAGYTWEELRSWTKRRFRSGHEDERRWPRGFSQIQQLLYETA